MPFVDDAASVWERTPYNPDNEQHRARAESIYADAQIVSIACLENLSSLRHFDLTFKEEGQASEYRSRVAFAQAEIGQITDAITTYNQISSPSLEAEALQLAFAKSDNYETSRILDRARVRVGLLEVLCEESAQWITRIRRIYDEDAGKVLDEDADAVYQGAC